MRKGAYAGNRIRSDLRSHKSKRKESEISPAGRGSYCAEGGALMDTMDIAYWIYTILAWLAGLVMLMLFVLFVQDITQTKKKACLRF